MTIRTKREAIRVLRDVEGDKRFFCNDGCISKNLVELSVCLSHMSQENFDHHVSDNKNDFISWIRDIFGDNQLADDLSGTRIPAEAARIISERIAWLHKKFS